MPRIKIGSLILILWAQNISAKCNTIETYYDIRESKEFRYLNSYDWKITGKKVWITRYIYMQKLTNCRLRLPK